uniref:Zgc:172341 n=1 Tax=Sinocyclocheilus rhinocerous TaxID=307959 RepID=A0A673L830_9TELE
MKCVEVLVVGAGVVGLSTAVCVAETLPYCSVIVIDASNLPLYHVFEIPLERQKRWFKESFDHLLAIADPPQMLACTKFFKDIPCDKKPFWSDFVFGFRYMIDHEMKRFPNHKFGQAFTTLKCECLNYLPWLEKRYYVQDVREEVWKESLQQKQHILKFLQHSYQQIMIQNVLLGHLQRPHTRLSSS